MIAATQAVPTLEPTLRGGALQPLRISLATALLRGNNNFDLLRLVAALLVIVGHARALTLVPQNDSDFVLRWLHFDYAGSLAVKFFFFLSGVLVTNSILAKNDLPQFAVSRFLRIFPGLLVCLLISVLILGPLFTILPIKDFLQHRDTWQYLTHNLLLTDLRWTLPGVFPDSKRGVNGSLWTLPCEVLCYLYLMAISAVWLLRARRLATALLVLLIGVAFFSTAPLAQFSNGAETRLLPACFALGALAALYKSELMLQWQPAIGLGLLFALSDDPAFHQLVFYVAFFYTAILISTLRFVVKRLHLPFDASYGVYIYGFTVQQALYTLFPSLGIHRNMVYAGAISIGLGALSWFLIEKPALTHGRHMFERVRTALAPAGR